ncbi:MAG: DUF4388 domain-containing protein [Acidobacteriota bacterium]
MSLNGKLEDVSLADVMQFIHLGRRTGTLSLLRGDDEAEIGFHRGQIVGARAPGTRPLAEVLVEMDSVHPEAMNELLAEQKSEQPRRSLGQILVQRGLLPLDDVRAGVERQIESAIFDLVTWTTGTFEFALDELKPNEDIAMYPGDVIPKLNLNTQMLLLEATRVLDEARRAEADGLDPRAVMAERLSRGPVKDPVDDEPPIADGGTRLSEEIALDSVSDLVAGLDLEGDSPNLLPEAAARRLQVVSPDRRLADALAEMIQPEIAQVVRVPLREAGTRLPGEPSPTLVMLDLRDGHHAVDDLLAIRRSRPRSSAIAVVDSPALTTAAFEAGAVAAMPAEPAALAACFHSLVRTLQDAGPRAVTSKAQRAGFARLRRVLADIRSGLLSATMALNLMHIISESVERAVLFLVKQDSLSALGAFGFSESGRPLAEVTRSLALSTDEDNVLNRCVHDGQPRSLGFDQARLPEELRTMLGRPHNGQIVVFPVMGSERVISVVYTDNGPSAHAIEDIELLELATAQVGVAFENELLRRQIQSR